MLKRQGIWAKSDPDRIAGLRAAQREEEHELQQVQEQIKAVPDAKSPLDLNKAGKQELESLPGIGPALAERIIAARPFKTVDGLHKVPGIGQKKFERIRDLVTIGSEK